MSKYGHVEHVDTYDCGYDFIKFDVTFSVNREVAAEFMDDLIPFMSEAKRDPIGAILDHSADPEGAD